MAEQLSFDFYDRDQPWTGRTVSLAEADAMQDELLRIMIDTGCVFGEALNVYIDRQQRSEFVAPEADCA